MTTERPAEQALIEEDDLLKLLRASDGAILIGGQALAFWMAYFGIEIPAGPRAYISADADFLGFAEHVKIFSDAIGGRPIYPAKRAMTALHGAVTKETKDGRKIGVDVLRQVVGVSSIQVGERAIAVHHPKDPTLRFQIMEPVDCLVSRVENLRQLPEKQNAVGVWQGNIGIAICNAYLKELVALGEERKAIRAATAILKLTGTAPGLQVFWKYGLDLLSAIPIESFRTESFKKEQFARTVAHVHSAREARSSPPASKKMRR
jgi:hypothetical protein